MLAIHIKTILLQTGLVCTNVMFVGYTLSKLSLLHQKGPVMLYESAFNHIWEVVCLYNTIVLTFTYGPHIIVDSIAFFNDDTRLSEHISRPTQVDVFCRYFHSSSRLIKPDWTLCTGWTLDRIGLHLFNDDTRPSGHISRPTQVNVFRCCFHTLNRLMKSDCIAQVGC